MEIGSEADHTKNALERYYSDLRFRLDNFAVARRKLDKYLSSEFNVLKLIDPDENRLSDIISDLLDSRGTHGQGELFLKLFLDAIDLSSRYNPDYRVVREDVTAYIGNSGRRIDVTVDFGTFGIGIENKPWASDLEEQVSDYILHLDKKYCGNYALVYMPGDGRDPGSIKDEKELASLKSRGKLHVLAYSAELLKWLYACHSDCESDKYRWFLRDLIAYIDANFNCARQEDADVQ